MQNAVAGVGLLQSVTTGTYYCSTYAVRFNKEYDYVEYAVMRLTEFRHLKIDEYPENSEEGLVVELYNELFARHDFNLETPREIKDSTYSDPLFHEEFLN